MTRVTSGFESAVDLLRLRFRDLFGTTPLMFRAPGRVNLIGDHTDYNDGFVMPMAIGFYTWVGAAKRNDRNLEAYSEHFEERITLALDALYGPPRKNWSDFVRGVAATLQENDYAVAGTSLIIHGEIPLGAGLSSSASLEMSLAMALTSIAEVDVSRLQLVKLCQSAEHKYVGTRCGIMDQFISAFGEAGHALMLDCRSLEYQLLPIPQDIRVIVCNSMVRHELASGEYNLRRAACEEGVRLLQSALSGIRALRDVDAIDLEKHKNMLPNRIYRRCRHVVTENERVQAAKQALQTQDVAQFGQLMYESHNSLRDDYQVSCRELDVLVDLASSRTGVYGARMTGGGFGGCTVNLVQSESSGQFETEMVEMYEKATGKVCEIYVCEPAQGAEALPTQF